jgi:hypothetical protein
LAVPSPSGFDDRVNTIETALPITLTADQAAPDHQKNGIVGTPLISQQTRRAHKISRRKMGHATAPAAGRVTKISGERP